MDKADDNRRFVALWEELQTSHGLIRAGFGHLQEIDGGNDFYHLPHLLLASGIEKFMKCYIMLVEYARTGSYPGVRRMKGFGHNLVKILDTVCDKYYDVNTSPILAAELAFLKKDRTLRDCVQILSDFGEQGRYYNLNVVAGERLPPIDPKTEWLKLENRVEDIAPYLEEQS